MTPQEHQLQAEIDRLRAGPAGAAPGDIGYIGPGLKRIGELAGDAFPEAAAIAAELLGELDQPDTSADEILKTGLIRLQEAFHHEPAACRDSPPVAGAGLADDPELVADFVVESREHLANIEANLLQLEKNPALLDAVHSVFRSFHTIKGLTGFLGFAAMHVVSHETESLLHQAREGRIAICGKLIDITLKAADYIRVAIDALDGKPAQEALASLGSNAGLLKEIASTSEFLLSAPAGDEEQENSARVETAPADSTEAPGPTGPSSGETRRSTDASVVRVDTGKLEYLVEMVGELVIAQSIIQMGGSSDKGVLSRNFAQLGRVTGEIQKTVLSMRMVPISRLYDKMARLVRDLARKSGKRIELRRIGDQVELDRNIVEEITDPIVHMIRNSVDHGIEDTVTRMTSGKSETAYVTLEAFHQAGYIILRMSDDGRGLPTARILEKAVQKGLVSPDARIDDQSIHKLIFEPGFSTAERVTDISGRGVGMDVVRRQIEKLRGTIEIESKPGAGCAFTLKLPLTLAMVDGLILEAGGERYVLPIYSVREMFHVTEDKIFTVENRAEMVLLRGSLLPIVRLDRFFASHAAGQGSGEIGIVVEGRTRQFCLVVDRMLGKQEVVIKTLGSCFQSVRGVAGGAILGDGRVGLILDVHGIDGGDANEG
jgi:two-component system chemotaxis sensor kinase CheA